MICGTLYEIDILPPKFFFLKFRILISRYLTLYWFGEYLKNILLLIPFFGPKAFTFVLNVIVAFILKILLIFL